MTAEQWLERIPDFIPSMPRNLWTMPLLDREWLAQRRDEHLREFWLDLMEERGAA